MKKQLSTFVLPLIPISLFPIITISCNENISSKSNLDVAFNSFSLIPKSNVNISTLPIGNITNEETLNNYFQQTGTMQGFKYELQYQSPDLINNKLLVVYKISMIDKNNKEKSKLIELNGFAPIS